MKLWVFRIRLFSDWPGWWTTEKPFLITVVGALAANASDVKPRAVKTEDGESEKRYPQDCDFYVMDL